MPNIGLVRVRISKAKEAGDDVYNQYVDNCKFYDTEFFFVDRKVWEEIRHGRKLETDLDKVALKRPKRLPATRPSKLLDKMKSFKKAVSGPKAPDEVFEARFKQCTRYGGCTWSQLDGVVESIENNIISIDGFDHDLTDGELPVVEVGDKISRFQPLATLKPDAQDKACPYLVKKANKGYFCGGCGCGKWKLAELGNKLRFEELECPREYPMFTPLTVGGVDNSNFRRPANIDEPEN